MIRTRQRQTGGSGNSGGANLRVISLLAITAVLSSLLTTAAVLTVKSPNSSTTTSQSTILISSTPPPPPPGPPTEEPIIIDLPPDIVKHPRVRPKVPPQRPDLDPEFDFNSQQHLFNWGAGPNETLPLEMPWTYDPATAPKINIAFITLDTTRFDSAEAANMTNLKRFMDKTKSGPFRKVYSHGTFSLPSHVSMLLYGRIPTDRRSTEPVYNDLTKCFFSVAGNTRKYDCIYKIPKAMNIPRSFEMIGYRTIGIGGVSWFNPRIVTSDFWGRDYFQEFYYHFRSARSIVLPTQMEVLREIKLKETQAKDKKPVFLFFNIREMHDPYSAGVKVCLEKGHSRDYCYEMTDRQEIQPLCLEYVDKWFPEMFALLPKPVHVVLIGDHGDCFNDCIAEGHPRGHGFYHDKIIEVPMVHFILEDDDPYTPVNEPEFDPY